MESQECELFCQQSEEASRLNQRLGFGIGLFQVVTDQLTNKRLLLESFIVNQLVKTFLLLWNV
jgi:hypothetical protein